MNTKQLAEELGVHYQTVSRAVRAVLKAEGTYTKITKTQARNGVGMEFSTELEAKVRDRVKLAMAYHNKKIRSTEADRRKWTAAWEVRFFEARQADWVPFACVLAVIGYTKVPGWISKPMGKARIGDYALRFAEQVTTGDDDSGFMAWLRENGFESSNTMEIL